MELTKPSGFVAQSVDTYHVVDTVLCLGISVLSTYSYHPFISTTIYPKILSNLLNLSCYMELLNLSGFIFFIRPCQLRLGFYLVDKISAHFHIQTFHCQPVEMV